LIPNIHPAYDPKEDYDVHWGFADYTGKTILDLGADVGSTASWFLRHGAKAVTAVEGSPIFFKKLKRNAKRLPNTTIIRQMIQGDEDLAKLLEIPADVVKVDIEGAENFLALVSRKTLRLHKEYVLEAHNPMLGKIMETTFQRGGFIKKHEFQYLDRLPIFHFVRDDSPEPPTQVMENVVVLIPIYQMATVFKKVQQFLYELNPQPRKYIFVENNSTDGTLDVIAKFERPHEIINFTLDDSSLPFDGTYYTAHEVIGLVRQLLLTEARKLDVDYAIFLDADIAPLTRDMIGSLTGWGDKADIIGGPYIRPFPSEPLLDVFWKTSVPGDWAMRRTARVAVQPLEDVAIVGGGCMCLTRKILKDERMNFWPRNPKWIPEYSEDHAFCLDALDFGYKVALDTTVQLSHGVYENPDRQKPWMLGVDGKPLKFTYNPSKSNVLTVPSQARRKTRRFQKE
jgi:GT2 family glycosyltransferase/precorrin-6B methylase 2